MLTRITTVILAACFAAAVCPSQADVPRTKTTIREVVVQPRCFDGEIEYRNKSRETLYVSDVIGFGRPVDCGYLVPDGVAGLSLQAMTYPKKTTIRWTIGEGDQAKRHAVSLDLDSKLKPQRGAILVFEYTAGRKWVVRFEAKK